MPLFSIVTVTLNPPAEDLQRTLESVVEQEFGDWELIVKDGGSREGTFDGVPKDPRIHFVNEPDTGIFDAMNQALDMVRGDYVCFLNAGDTFYDRNALVSVAATAEVEPEVDFFYGDVAKPRSRSGFEIYPVRLTRYFLFSHSICHQSWFVSKRYYDKDKRYETGRLAGADPRFLLRMKLADKVRSKKIQCVLTTYQGGGVSARPDVSNEAKEWFDEIRVKLYSRGEYFTYEVLFDIRNVLKKTFYDRLGWRILRCLRRLGCKI